MAGVCSSGDRSRPHRGTARSLPEGHTANRGERGQLSESCQDREQQSLPVNNAISEIAASAAQVATFSKIVQDHSASYTNSFQQIAASIAQQASMSRAVLGNALPVQSAFQKVAASFAAQIDMSSVSKSITAQSALANAMHDHLLPAHRAYQDLAASFTAEVDTSKLFASIASQIDLAGFSRQLAPYQDAFRSAAVAFASQVDRSKLSDAYRVFDSTFRETVDRLASLDEDALAEWLSEVDPDVLDDDENVVVTPLTMVAVALLLVVYDRSGELLRRLAEGLWTSAVLVADGAGTIASIKAVQGVLFIMALLSLGDAADRRRRSR